MALVGQVGSFLYLPALPTISLEFVTDEPAVQRTVVAFFLGSLVGFALFGPLSDRFGHTLMLAAAGVLFVAGCVGSALAPELGALVAARFVQGVGSVAGMITARTVIRDAFPPGEAVRLVSLVSAANAASVAASPILGAFLLTMISWRAGFWVNAAFATFVTVTAVIVLPRSIRRPVADTLPGIRQIVASPTWRACLLITGGTTSAFMVMMAASPFVFITALGTSPITYSWIMAIVLGGYGVVAVRTGRMAGRLGAKQAMKLAVGPMLFGAVAVTLVAFLAPGMLALTTAMMLMIGSMGVLVPSAHLTMLAPFPNLAGTAACIGMLVSTSCGALAVWVYAETLAGSIAGFGAAIAALTLLSAIGWLLLPSTEAYR
jgi:DHA1 family bicyclomycin/chloramphenicol resistance-like MFS transporter